MIIKALSVVTVLLLGVTFGGMVGIIAAGLGASPAAASVAAASIAVASMGVGLSVLTILFSAAGKEGKP